MHTPAVHRIARAARAAGASTLRFQFRGVGGSEGRHDAGRGERDDVRAALGWVRPRAGGRPLLLAGFSFGAWMALEAGCPQSEVTGLLLAGLAHRDFEAGAPRDCPKPLACVQAEGDQFMHPDEVATLLGSPAFPRRLARVPGASHLFTEDLGTLEREARAAFVWLLEGAA
jgi:alpha/beta superfamily hydrolase